MATGTQPKPSTGHPKNVQLVRKITEKTRAKKIFWKKSETGYSASVSGELEIGFVRQPSIFSTGGWSLFTIRDKRGNEILRADNPVLPGVSEVLLESAQRLLREPVNELFKVVEAVGTEEIEKAIELVDRV